MTAKDEWRSLPWKQFQVEVSKLQTRIFRASRRGDVRIVRKLQRLLMSSQAARYVAVRRVTQDNRGKRAAGIDGKTALRPAERLALARTLRLDDKPQPVRRVWIPKPGKAEKRPLGIPTIRDRAVQALVKLALEPEWEAKFEPNSYGFRPGRSVHDAVSAVAHAMAKPKYVLDADIASCFDRIDHEALLAKIDAAPRLQKVIRHWLTAGAREGRTFFPTTAGTPQGGVISPLLANIALHGLEMAIQSAFPERRYDLPGRPQWRPLVVRYADDFVVLHQDLATIGRVREIVTEWLSHMGLELKPSKTRIGHTQEPHDGRLGFDFLGFTFRHVARDQHGRRYEKGYHLHIRPSIEAQKRHYGELAGEIKLRKAASQADLIATLNRMIDGWADYYRVVGASQVLSRMDHLLWRRLWRWATRRHPNKARRWVAAKYWPTLHTRGSQERAWTFRTQEGFSLVRHARLTHLHVKVAGTASPFDGNLVYWASRLGRHPQLNRTWATLLKRQGGRCAACGLHFLTLDEAMEADHRLPLTLGGTKALGNLQLLHGHCHDRKTAQDGSDRQRRANTHRGWSHPRGPRKRGTLEWRPTSRSRVRGNSHARF